MTVANRREYADIGFNERVAGMFADLVAEKEVRFAVLRFIAATIQQYRKNSIENVGVTINDIIEGVRLYRTKRKPSTSKESYTYESVKDNITRKTAEQVVEQLSLMSLIYAVPVGPSKMLFTSERGLQVMKVLLEREKRQ